MKKYLTSFLLVCNLSLVSWSQSVGIGTTTPHPKAALEIKATGKGVLFPNMTNAQRNAISDVPDGLHIFNTDERCLNYYDSLNQIWNCYCENCKTVVIEITSNACKLDFYNAYAKQLPATRYLLKIAPGVTISGCGPGDTALILNTLPFDATITINNFGTIAGAGGSGGTGALAPGCSGLSLSPTPGKAGGSAISTRPGVLINVNNQGVIAGGGGGGAGSSSSINGQYPGGGGGGAGTVAGLGGTGGGTYISGQFGGCFTQYNLAQPGQAGTATSGGPGGTGVNGGANGGNGGNMGQPGGNGNTANGGGAAGKAITGGTGNILNNTNGGQSFGVVD